MNAECEQAIGDDVSESGISYALKPTEDPVTPTEPASVSHYCSLHLSTINIARGSV